MAITKVSQYNSTPTVIADYQAQNNYLQAIINQSNGLKNILYQATTEIPKISQGSYIAMGGTLYIIDTENYTILGSALNGDNYISISVSGNSLIATWIQNISSYVWNNVYNYYSDGTNILLPYKINYDTTYTINPFNQFTNQNLNTDSDVTHNNITANGTLTTNGTIVGIHTYENITDTQSSGTYYYTINSMEIGELRLLATIFTDNISPSSSTFNVYLPSGGTYAVIGEETILAGGVLLLSFTIVDGTINKLTTILRIS